ncbi:hypothetical protein GALL_291150 [mine drainage metagenome]|uniref:Calcineurin-like phosphoesterase domain-containing protein n=1 Tax=mine drainage metagenome TaxID=410659 RepID=A0A1J5QZD9_9ZZZZ
MTRAGRFCPAGYGYAPAAFAGASEIEAETLYVVGGLYGNGFALDAVQDMAAAERGPVSIVFNGDFNWFNIRPDSFAAINARVLRHTALRGNVETELAGDDRGAGCGCAYPETVSDAEVARSNRILDMLRDTARDFPDLRAQLAGLPMLASARVGGLRIGIVHGDAESLAGWRFAQQSLDAPDNLPWLDAVHAAAGVDLFASSHTCLPALREFALSRGSLVVINNGAAGLPNFSGTRYGLLTRISTGPAPITPVYGVRRGGVHVDALPIHYDHARWIEAFLSDWPSGSPAHDSYYRRISEGPGYGAEIARPGLIAA